ncbi:MAG: type I methionyl aminopeptidase [Acidimicrobiia bacterium]|nr:type I methionyl aminopeptidase [Acidimicrobiia bacterium]
MVPPRLRSNDPCWCGSGKKLKRCHGAHPRRPAVRKGEVSPRRDVPDAIVRPPYVATRTRSPREGVQVFTDPAEVVALRHSGAVAAEILLEVGAAVEVGVTTDELDRIAHEAYLSRGAYPSDLGYGTYGKSVCTSVNEVVCHGIPDSRPLADGDVVNVDVTGYVGGFHGDTSATFLVGDVDEPTRALIEATRRATLAGITATRSGVPLRAIGEAVTAVAFEHGYGVVREYGGHGTGRTFHSAPWVAHTVDPRATEPLVVGMVFTVEPMLTAGAPDIVQWDDGWTIVTRDGLVSAQFEHTVLLTEDGPELLTVTADGRTAVGTLTTAPA